MLKISLDMGALATFIACRLVQQQQRRAGGMYPKDLHWFARVHNLAPSGAPVC